MYDYSDNPVVRFHQYRSRPQDDSIYDGAYLSDLLNALPRQTLVGYYMRHYDGNPAELIQSMLQKEPHNPASIYIQSLHRPFDMITLMLLLEHPSNSNWGMAVWAGEF